MTVHHVAHAIEGRLLFRTWGEGLALWHDIVSRSPGLVALCLMPNHVHLLTRSPVSDGLRCAMRAHARRLNHARGVSGPLWLPLPAPEPIVGATKQRRQERYVHLNPCRARLVSDPLAWPLSTHRDAVGLCVHPIRPARRDADAFHRYVSSDPSVAVDGTTPPWSGRVDLHGPGGLEAVWRATSAAARAPVEHMERRGRARTLFVRVARTLTAAPTREIAEWASMSQRAVQLVEPARDEAVRVIEQVAGDPRFPAIQGCDPLAGWPWSVGRAHRR